ncbi:DinB family protein [Asticcacaulis sp.]|uniref:DinB family protein n=1 Tax=Asticcacaulis sp. TaxID=1872648 RepID=UPI002B97B19A|nr:DinB family protein [Asticcacaulis sp.]HTM82153.1 DinB family protein [Asticcacaulis sp.]
MQFKDHLRLMAAYNSVMNARLIALVTPLPDKALLENRGAFFGSVLGTLNHLVVADLMWLNRFRPQPYGQMLAPLDALPKPAVLADLLYPTLAELTPVRKELDALYIRFIDQLSDADIASPLSYRSATGGAFTKTTGLLLSHVFNHQTHHRGQITTLLSQMGLNIGVTDLAPLVPNIEVSE